MRFVIAIPSHRRADRLKETLDWLYSTAAPEAAQEVRIFLSDERDLHDYKKTLREWCPPDSNGPVAHPKLKVTGVHNVIEKFNAIHMYYRKGTRVFVLEDDVTVVVPNERQRPRPMEGEELLDVIMSGFTHVGRAGLWGIVPHSNPYYFGGKITTSLKLVVAHAFGFVSTKDPRLKVTQMGKSDYERTILYFIRYGKVVRVDTAGCLTKSYTAKGGIQSNLTRDERAEAELESCDYLVRRYGHLIRHNTKKKSLFAELKFSRRMEENPALLQALQQLKDVKNGFV